MKLALIALLILLFGPKTTSMGGWVNVHELNNWERMPSDSETQAIVRPAEGIEAVLIEQTKLAEAGDARAQSYLGLIFSQGEPERRDFARAAQWLQLAAKSGNARGMDGLGYLYERGVGVEKDLPRAIDLYRTAADQGYLPALVHLSACYLSGTGVPMDKSEGVRLLHLSADRGNLEGECALMRYYLFGDSNNRDYLRGLYWLRRAAKASGAENSLYFVAWAFDLIFAGLCLVLALVVWRRCSRARARFLRPGAA